MTSARIDNSRAALDRREDDRVAARDARIAAAEQVTINVEGGPRTNRACLIRRADGSEVWIANSLLKAVPCCDGGRHDITLPRWKAEQEGLL